MFGCGCRKAMEWSRDAATASLRAEEHSPIIHMAKDTWRHSILQSPGDSFDKLIDISSSHLAERRRYVNLLCVCFAGSAAR